MVEGSDGAMEAEQGNSAEKKGKGSDINPKVTSL